MVDNEIKDLILDFLEKCPRGKVTLLYPHEIEFIREGIRGIEITKTTLKGEKIIFNNYGIFIHNTLGFSLVTGKHLFLPYGSFSIVFEEGV